MPVTVETAANVITVTIRAIKYINEVKHASKKRATIETTSLLSLLFET